MDETDKFLGVLVPHRYPREAGGEAVEVEDYALRIPLDDMPWPPYMVEDCEPEAREAAFVDYIRPFIVRARDGANDEDVSVGAFMNFADGAAYLCFKQVYVGDLEYPTLRDLDDSGDLARLPGNVRSKLAELLRYFESCVFDAVRAANEAPGPRHAWLPEPYRAFADFYDDAAYADWSDLHWFAFENRPDLLSWLAAQDFAGRAAWHLHPCIGALVIAFESPADAETFQATWGGA
ncbi:MAG: hypothetical protein H6907_22195 [Hyphomicrobiales bacterium]|nr:hypothetical protein [Hyphomicrobiales bacterium]